MDDGIAVLITGTYYRIFLFFLKKKDDDNNNHNHEVLLIKEQVYRGSVFNTF